jgi:hypothetical protein
VDGPAFDELLKTVAPTVAKRKEAWEQRSVQISVYPLCYAVWPREVLLKTGTFFLDV